MSPLSGLDYSSESSSVFGKSDEFVSAEFACGMTGYPRCEPVPTSQVMTQHERNQGAHCRENKLMDQISDRSTSPDSQKDLQSRSRMMRDQIRQKIDRLFVQNRVVNKADLQVGKLCHKSWSFGQLCLSHTAAGQIRLGGGTERPIRTFRHRLVTTARFWRGNIRL